MRTPACERARRTRSAAFDGDLVDVAEDAAAREHLAACADCRAFDASMRATRAALRGADEATGAAPGSLLAGVLATVATEPTDDAAEVAVEAPPTARRARRARRRASPARTWLPVAACVLVGIVLGGLLVSRRAVPPSAASTIPEQVVAAQGDLTSLRADLTLTEHGWSAAVPRRTFQGTLAYAAPERLALHLDDTTAYPGPDWVGSDVDLVVRDDSWWSRGLRDCPGPATAACTTAGARTAAVTGREPFDAGTPAPLDLAVPVGSFDRADQPELLGTRAMAGREAVGVVTTAAQVGPLLDGLRTAGNLRALFPSDRVELWLDRTALVPLALHVTATAAPERGTWARNHGYADEPGAPLLDLALDAVELDGPVADDRFPPPPADAVVREAGFTSAIDQASRAAAVRPPTAPLGLADARAGTAGAGTATEAVVRTWTRGRSWVKVRVADGWRDRHLFGEPGRVIRTVALADGSPAYTDAAGTKVAVHGDDVDLVVEGSFPVDRLLAVASSLGVRGERVPADWADASTATVADAARVVPGVLVAPAPPSPVGLEAPAVRADGNVVTLAYAGAGGRAVVIVETPGERLSPPLDMDATAVDVRGRTGRWSPGRSELEWVEGGVSISLRSSTLALGELLALADALGPP